MLMGVNNRSADDAQKERFYKRVWSEIITKPIDGITSAKSIMKLELRKGN